MVATLVAMLLVAQAPQAKANGEGAGAPERAVRAFLVAMTTKDAPALRALTMPSDDLDLLLQGQAIEADAVEQFKAAVAKLPIPLLKEGDVVPLPGGGSYKAKGVTPDHAIALPRGAAFPVEVWKKGERWLVDASPIIAAMKPAAPKAVDPGKIREKITINLGQKLDLQFTGKGDAISEPKIVDKPKAGEPTVHVEFTRMNSELSLITRNPFSKPLSFRALARNKGSKAYYETSIVPVQAGIFGLELWRDAIEELVLFEFRLGAWR